MNPKYSLIIRWSDEDRCYIAWIPEFGIGTATHGQTYEEAAKAGREVIESLLEIPESERPPLPAPWLYESVADDIEIGRAILPKNAAYRPARKKSSAVA